MDANKRKIQQHKKQKAPSTRTTRVFTRARAKKEAAGAADDDKKKKKKVEPAPAPAESAAHATTMKIATASTTGTAATATATKAAAPSSTMKAPDHSAANKEARDGDASSSAEDEVSLIDATSPRPPPPSHTHCTPGKSGEEDDGGENAPMLPMEEITTAVQVVTATKEDVKKDEGEEGRKEGDIEEEGPQEDSQEGILKDDHPAAASASIFSPLRDGDPVEDEEKVVEEAVEEAEKVVVERDVVEDVERGAGKLPFDDEAGRVESEAGEMEEVRRIAKRRKVALAATGAAVAVATAYYASYAYSAASRHGNSGHSAVDDQDLQGNGGALSSSNVSDLIPSSSTSASILRAVVPVAAAEQAWEGARAVGKFLVADLGRALGGYAKQPDQAAPPAAETSPGNEKRKKNWARRFGDAVEEGLRGASVTATAQQQFAGKRERN